MAGDVRPWWFLPWGLVAAGIALRILAISRFQVSSDASEYAVLARSILGGRGMWLPWGELWEFDTWVPGPSHHYPPAYPAFLTPFIAVIGFSPIAVQVAAFVAGLALLVVFFVATRDLFGREKATWFVGLLALDPVLVTTTGTGFGENLVTLLFVLTVAAILKSLTKPRWILVAGLAAGLAYLTKSGVGPFFLVAGLAGFAWRFRFARWAVFRDRTYLAGIGIFGALAGGWALRNLVSFWDGTAAGLLRDWQSSAWFSLALDRTVAMPLDFAWILAVRVPFFAALFLLVAGPWWREIRSLPLLRDEASSALGLAAGLTYVLAWLISGVLWVFERGPVFWADLSRYVVFANPVVWWMAAKGSDPASPTFRRKVAVAATVLVVINGAAFLSPRLGVFEAYSDLRARAVPGDTVALDRLNKYEAELHLAGSGVDLEPYSPATRADYVLTGNVTRSYAGYSLVDVYGSGNGSAVMPGFGAALWNRTGDPTP
jgi:4-amino-4-deoxy-L-arabinose transferase-like glycosyltransferase